jgi:hypothetical protein
MIAVGSLLLMLMLPLELTPGALVTLYLVLLHGLDLKLGPSLSGCGYVQRAARSPLRPLLQRELLVRKSSCLSRCSSPSLG